MHTEGFRTFLPLCWWWIGWGSWCFWVVYVGAQWNTHRVDDDHSWHAEYGSHLDLRKRKDKPGCWCGLVTNIHGTTWLNCTVVLTSLPHSSWESEPSHMMLLTAKTQELHHWSDKTYISLVKVMGTNRECWFQVHFLKVIINSLAWTKVQKVRRVIFHRYLLVSLPYEQFSKC